MLGSRALLPVLERVPLLSDGPRLHRAGLEAMAAGDWMGAERLFECAALRYRRRLAVEPLARLRVHQLMARARAAGVEDETLALEVERRLCRLDLIESPDAPYERVEARRLLALWRHAPDARAAA